MRILMLGTSFPRHAGSGIGKFVFELARALNRRHRVHVLTANFPGGKHYEEMDGVAVHRFKYFLPGKLQRLTYPGGLPDQLKVSWLARLQLPLFFFFYVIQCALHLKHADAVICNWIYTGTIMQIAEKLSFRKRCCLVVVRGSDMRLIEQGGVTSGILLRTLRKADAVCVVARDFVEVLRGYDIENASFTPNGIHRRQFDLDQKQARQELHLGDKAIVLYVGSLIDRKDVATLVRAMDGINAKLVLAGDGEQRGKLEDEVAEKGIDSLFLGNIPAEQVPLWIAAADIFVLPSLYEGRPNALIEAMTAGKACIATDIKGTRELIEDGASGCLFPPRDVHRLHECLRGLLNDQDRLRQLGRQAENKIRNEVPSWQECAQNYQRVIADCMASEDEPK